MHVKLTESSSFLTTFWGPQGRYRWLRLPFGISSALRSSCTGYRRPCMVLTVWWLWPTMCQCMGPVSVKRKHVASMRRLWYTSWDVLNSAISGVYTCQSYCILAIKSPQRVCGLTQPKSELYIGHQISKEGVWPDPAKVRAIKGMAAPESASDVRFFNRYV